MRKVVLLIFILVLTTYITLAENNIKWDDAPVEKLFKVLESVKQTPQEDAIAKEFVAVNEKIGEQTIVIFVNDVMAVYFTDGTAASTAIQWAEAIARNALDFLLIRTGRNKGTVAFYNPRRIKMFSMSGTLLSAELELYGVYDRERK